MAGSLGLKGSLGSREIEGDIRIEVGRRKEDLLGGKSTKKSVQELVKG